MKAVIDIGDVPEFQIGRIVRVYFPDSMIKSGWSKPASGWVSVKDRLPNKGHDVLAFLDDGEETRIAACNYWDGVWFDAVMNTIAKNVVCWMPLPEPPEEVTVDG